MNMDTKRWVKTILFAGDPDQRPSDEEYREKFPHVWTAGPVKITWGDDEISVMKVCEKCGALVADDIAHDDWHAGLEAGLAARAWKSNGS